MKYVFGLAGLLALLMTPAARGADLNGTWRGAFDFQGSSVPLIFHLTATNGGVTGSVEGLPTNPAEIHEGKVDGDTVSFWVNTDYQGETYKLHFKGQLDSDAIAFTMATDDGSWNSRLKAHRSGDAAATGSGAAAIAADKPAASSGSGADLPAASVDLNGAWKGSFAYQGVTFPLTLRMVSSGNSVTGSLEGLAPDANVKPTEIHDGKVAGGTLSFWANVDYQGETYKLVYTGKITAGKIDFTFGTDDGSWSGQFTVKKQ